MWNDSIIEAVRRAPVGSLDLTDFGHGVVSLGAEAARGRVVEAIISKVKHLAPQIRLDHVNQLCSRIGVDLPVDLMMTTDQVRLLANAGQEIGAHTMTHPILKTLSDEEARNEIQLSRRALERITGRPVLAFAFPNGRPGDDYTRRDRDLVRELGFEFAASTMPGAACSHSDTYQLPRFTPWDQQPWRWLMRLLWMFGKPEHAFGANSLPPGQPP
jgi:peptidoglycan/xylan/chitin deacetylase (PgdA/CDA1 family)